MPIGLTLIVRELNCIRVDIEAFEILHELYVDCYGSESSFESRPFTTEVPIKYDNPKTNSFLVKNVN